MIAKACQDCCMKFWWFHVLCKTIILTLTVDKKYVIYGKVTVQSYILEAKICLIMHPSRS